MLAPNALVAQYIGTPLLVALSYFAGLFQPIASMPAALRYLAEATPLGAAARAMQDAWLGHWPHPVQLVTLVVWAVATVAGAVRASRSA
jgi:ABC-2 type transport system permease protein